MYSITTVTAHPTAIFAAEELKKYLRMMIPRGGNISITPGAVEDESFRLGLMQDFGLDVSDAEDPSLDDIIYIDTTENGGIIAGSNYGALLIAVYRYLRECGCRWLFPGVDGEYIPIKESLHPVSYRHLADHRYRGQCNEGSEYQGSMLESIDFSPKIGLNTYMLEFDIPTYYYDRYYNHEHNTVREPEPVTEETILQWKRQCEAEIEKRSLHFHDMGHGWTCLPFGLDFKLREVPENVPAETVELLAEVNGKRGVYVKPCDTNICMSNPKAREVVANYVADYAETQNNVDFLHIWLADNTNNHCECDECRKKTPTDWYVILLNDIDAELTKRNLDTHLVFIVYTETFWAPVEARLKNAKRFTMLYAPIFRLYTETYGEIPDETAVKPFKLNENDTPKGMAECLGYLEKWKKCWGGDCFCYEYHFWMQQYLDQSGLYLGKLLYDDIHALHSRGLSGIVEDGSQRSFFPTGFPFYVYGEALYDKSVSFDDLVEDYFSHAFGENWKKAVDYLDKVREIFDFEYISGLKSSDCEKGKYYNPEMTSCREKFNELAASFLPVIQKEKKKPFRVQTVSWKLLEYHSEWLFGFAEFISYLSEGNYVMATAAMKRLIHKFSEYEIYIERYFDLRLCCVSIANKINASTDKETIVL
ncbi:MAG: DUF4838 domain-containing protein [Ruminococcaceae bacterium]|nr:DUF4838 domain-containing protein [Oscillospiraceae bacterium]